MGTHAIIAVATALATTSACMVLPKTERKPLQSRVERGEGTVEDYGLRVQSAEWSGRAIAVRVAHRRACTYAAREITEQRVTRGARLWMPGGGDDAGSIFLLVFSIYTVPISAVVTGVAVAAHKDRTETRVKELPAERVACDAPAGGHSVWLAVLDRPIVRAVTDAQGIARFAVDVDLTRGDAQVGIDGVTPPSYPPPHAPPTTVAAPATPARATRR